MWSGRRHLRKRALITFGSHRHAELLDISRPLFLAYAHLHGYEYVEIDPADVEARAKGRPHDWAWLPILHDALDHYDEVLRVGADVVIVDGTQDISDDVPAAAWSAMVIHEVADGHVPNTDASILRSEMQPWLRDAWELDCYTHHPWWGQAALLHLMGIDPNSRPVIWGRATELRDNISWLPIEWNSHESSQRHPSPRFAHVTYGSIDWRLPIMRAYAEKAVWVE